MSNVVTVEIPLALIACIIFVISGLALKQYHEQYGGIWFHESMITAIFGLIVGGLFKYFTEINLSFNSNLFFYLILPPIIFSAGFSLKKKKFFRYGLSIAVFGIVGTLINFTVISIAAHAVADILGIPGMNWTNSMLLGTYLLLKFDVFTSVFIIINGFILIRFSFVCIG